MKEKIASLIDVKSIVTLALVAVLCVITLMGIEIPDLFSSSVMLVLGFFFGKNVQVAAKKEGPSTTTTDSEVKTNV